MVPSSRQSLVALLPGAALGLFCGRVAAEVWAVAAGATPWLLALLVTLLGAAGGIWLARRLAFRTTWPLLFLLAYVFYPQVSPTAALLVAAFVLLLLGFTYTAVAQPANPGGWFSAAALGLLLAFFALYVLTLAPDVLPADSGEFQTVATNLGVAHPPGFPLYTMLAHMMTRLPLGPNPAYRVNLFSALTSILALGAVLGGVYVVTQRRLAAAAAVLILGVATTFWAQATTANIRSLTALFAALILLAALGFYVASHEKSEARADRWLVTFAFFLALGIGHHASLAFLGLVAALFLLLVDGQLLRPSRRWLGPALAFMAGLLPLLYLPLRAGADVRGASPGLATWPGFSEHVLALGFRGDLFVYLEPGLLWERLKIMGNVLTFQFSLPVLALMAVGLVLAWRKDWRLAFCLGGSFALFTFITATYRAPQTVEYMLPAYVVLAFLAGFAAAGWPDRPDFTRIAGPLAAALLVTAALWQLTRLLPDFRWLHQNDDTRAYAATVLGGVPSGAEVLADWHWATPLWYLQEVEGMRPDSTVRFVFPEGEPYGETWARRIADGLEHGRAVASTHFDAAAYASLPPAQPLGEAFLFGGPPSATLPDHFTALDINLGAALALRGYQLVPGQYSAGQELVLTLAWLPLAPLPPGTTLFLHLLDADGRLRGQQDLPARPQPEGLTLTQFRLTPHAGTTPGPYTLVVGAYAAEPLPDADGRPRTPLTSLELGAMPFGPATQHPLNRQLLDSLGRVLAGYDWDRTLPDQPRLYLHWRQDRGYVTEVVDGPPPELPPYHGPWGVARDNWTAVTTPPSAGHYVPFGAGIVWLGEGLDPARPLAPGEELVLTAHFQSGRPVLRDYAVSTRLIGYEPESTQWAWWDLDDAIPAMGAIPTLKWQSGSRVRAPHFLTVPADATPGQPIGGALTLYETFTARPLPLLDDRLVRDYGWVPLGGTAVGERP